MATSQLPDRVACYRHADQLTGVHCTRCGRPICPACMVTAPVGHHCPACVREDGESVAGPRLGRWSAHRPTRMTPVVAVLIALNVIAYGFTSHHATWEFSYAQIPTLVAHGQPYRLLTAAFVHENLTHLLFNMAALAVMGPLVERALGRPRFLALYLLAALGGSVCSFLVGPVSVAGVGASGAIIGIIGAWFALARAQRSDTSAIVLLIVFLLAYSFYDTSIDWRAHVGGLLTGVALGAMFARAARLPPRSRVATEVAALAAFLALLAALVVFRSSQIGAV